jgi:uncharacterized damage-inducible protein DinB
MMRFFASVTLLFLSLPLAAQTPATPPANPMTNDAREAWGFAKSMVLRAAEKMPEENYSFKPVPEVRSFGELVTHVILAQNGMCGALKGIPAPKAQLDKPTKADLIAALKTSDAFCDTTFDGMTDARASEMLKLYGKDRARLTGLYMLAVHGYEHYGNIVVYMRLKGLVPPSSEPRK